MTGGRGGDKTSLVGREQRGSSPRVFSFCFRCFTGSEGGHGGRGTEDIFLVMEGKKEDVGAICG